MSCHRNWGSRRKPGTVRGGNLATSRARGRGGQAKGRARKGLRGVCPRPALLSLPRIGHKHEGPPAEMTVLALAWNPTSSLLLLLLLLSPGLRGTPDCSFTHSPITSNFAIKIQELSDYLLQDYPVTVASNLQDVSHSWEGPGMEVGHRLQMHHPAGTRLEELCKGLWRLVLAQRWMEQLKTVAGSHMQRLLESVNTEMHFVTLCPFQPLPSCLRFVQTDISHLLQDISAQLVALKPWITRRNFSQCLELQCQPDSSTLIPPRSPGALEATMLPASQSPLLLLLLLLPPTLLLPVAAWCLCWRRRRITRTTPRPGEQLPPVSCPQEVLLEEQ